MRSQHTASFAQLLNALGASVFVSTYQAGQLVLLRTNGELLNTHFRAFRKPMGLALREGRLAIGEHAHAGALRFFATGSLDHEPHAESILRRYLESALLTASVTCSTTGVSSRSFR